MRTTIDLPDDLLRQAKATAALRGMKLKQLITDCIEAGLNYGPPPSTLSARPARSAPPLIARAMTGIPIPALRNGEIAEIEMEEDLETLRRTFGR